MIHSTYKYFDGKAFLIRSQLRSVRNLSFLPAVAQNIVIKDLLTNLLPNEREPCCEIIQAWIAESSSKLRVAGSEWNKYKEWLNQPATDDFAGCYFSDGTISSIGLSLRMETRLRANADKLSSR